MYPKVSETATADTVTFHRVEFAGSLPVGHTAKTDRSFLSNPAIQSVGLVRVLPGSSVMSVSGLRYCRSSCNALFVEHRFQFSSHRRRFQFRRQSSNRTEAGLACDDYRIDFQYQIRLGHGRQQESVRADFLVDIANCSLRLSDLKTERGLHNGVLCRLADERS